MFIELVLDQGTSTEATTHGPISAGVGVFEGGLQQEAELAVGVDRWSRSATDTTF